MDKESILTGINRSLAEELLEFLVVFNDASEELQGQHQPTMQYVVLSRKEITNHLNENNSDHADVAEMEIIGKLFMEANWNESRLHQIAVFLQPQIKLKAFDETQRKYILASIVGKNIETLEKRRCILNKLREFLRINF